MFRTEKIEKLLKYAMLTGYVEGDVPTSIILISPPEHAKTSVIRGMQCPGTIELSDLSPKPITDKLIPKILNEHLHHVIIPDLVKPLSHKSVTVDATVAFLNAAMEEGVQQQMFFGQEFHLDRPLKFGIITSVTPEFFKKYFKKWNEIGFLSRFIPVSYEYSEGTIAEIHALIKRNELCTLYSKIEHAHNGMYKKFCNGAKKINVEIPDNEASYIAIQAQDIAKRLSEFKVKIYVQGGGHYEVQPSMIGFRLQRQLRMLTSAVALSNNRDVVNFSDIEEIKKLLEFIGYPETPVMI